MRITISLGALDVLRIAVIVVACICMVLMVARAVRQRRINGDRFTTWATLALFIFMLFAVIVESRQIGERPHTWWALPMLALGSLSTLMALRRSKV